MGHDLPQTTDAEFADAFRVAFRDPEEVELPQAPKDTRLLDGSGRWTRFTADRVRTVLAACRRGHAQSTAARLAGVSVRTLKRWKRRGREACEALESGEEEPAALEGEAVLLARFYVALEAARGRWAAEAVEYLQEVGFDRENGDWRALMELLKRQQPGTYGSASTPDPVDGGEEDGGADTINIAIRIDGGPPPGVEHDPRRVIVNDDGEGPDDAA